jgi:hypothetical protein
LAFLKYSLHCYCPSQDTHVGLYLCEEFTARKCLRMLKHSSSRR